MPRIKEAMPCRLPLHPPCTSTLRIIPFSTSTRIRREQTPFGRYVIVMTTPPLKYSGAQYSRYGDIIPPPKPYILWRMQSEVSRYDAAAKTGLRGANRVWPADRIGCGGRRAARGQAAALARPGAAAAGIGAHGAGCAAGGRIPHTGGGSGAQRGHVRAGRRSWRRASRAG